MDHQIIWDVVSRIKSLMCSSGGWQIGVFEGHPIGSCRQEAQDEINRRFKHIKTHNVVSQTPFGSGLRGSESLNFT